MRLRPVLTVVAVLLALTGCDPAPAATSPAATSPAAVARPSATSGAISPDRQTLAPVTVRPAGFGTAPAGEGLAGYLGQGLPWKACGQDQCATVQVPLDYANPSEQAITLALRKRPATRSPRLGSLIMNPGGPGAGGQWMAGWMAGKGLDAYDLIGLDVRGTGDSTPVSCWSDAEEDAFLALDFSPDDTTEMNTLVSQSRAFAAACWRTNGDYLNHLSSVEIARDLDVLRKLLGDDKLHFLGFSYGTMLGATYAELFPDKVGHLVLDSPVSLADKEEVFQTAGFELAFNHWTQYCASTGCASGGVNLGTTPQAVHDAVAAWLAKLDGAPVTVGKRTLTQSLATMGVAGLLYQSSEWPALRTALLAAMAGNGAQLLASADGMSDRNKNGHYGTLPYVLPATYCLDFRDTGIAGALADWETQKATVGMFGSLNGLDLSCATWAVPPNPYLDFKAVGAAPILVVGSTGDPATPYQLSEHVSNHLTSAVLLTYDGEGHGTFGGSSTCVNDAVVAYLTRDVVPVAGTRCR